MIRDIATSWNGWGMATGTVSVHSFSDGMDDDEGTPSMSSNYNARLDLREDFNSSAHATRGARGVATRTFGGAGFTERVLRSRVVPAGQYSDEDDTDEEISEEDDMRVPGAW